MKRFQARRGNGRFTRNTTENTFGLHVEFCRNADCRRLNPYGVGEPKPTHCHACNQPLVEEKPAPVVGPIVCECGHETNPWHPRGGECMDPNCGCKQLKTKERK